MSIDIQNSRYLPYVDQLHTLNILAAIARISRAQVGVEGDELKTAFLGDYYGILFHAEAMSDLGYQITYFEGNPQDSFHPSKGIDGLQAGCFDCLIIADTSAEKESNLARIAVDQGYRPVFAKRIIEAHRNVLFSMQAQKIVSCLNPHKWALIAAAVSMSPEEGAVIECGVYMGGTTILIALMQRALGISRPIYALDTFEGMPPATINDKLGAYYYDSGMFTDNQISLVSSFYRDMGVAGDIKILKGLCQETLPQVFREVKHVSFSLLDTDQYAGTSGGLVEITPRLRSTDLVIVDDTTVHGVDVAIKETLLRDAQLRRHRLCHNFELLNRSSHTDGYSDRPT